MRLSSKWNSIWYPFFEIYFSDVLRCWQGEEGANLISNYRSARVLKNMRFPMFSEQKKVKNILWKPIRLLSRRSLRGASWIFLWRKILSRNRFRSSSLQGEKNIWSVVIRVVRLNEKRGNTVLLFMTDMKKRKTFLRWMGEKWINIFCELENIGTITDFNFEYRMIIANYFYSSLSLWRGI